MPSMPLRRALIRLAADHRDMRSDLLKILGTGNTSVVQQPPIVIQQPPVIIQQDVAAPAPTPIAVPVQVPVAAPAPAPVPPPAPVPVPVPPPPPIPAPAPPPAVGGALMVTERARTGFNNDLLPEMNRLRDSGMPVDQVASHMIGLITDAFRTKNHLYNILIRYQSTFEGDAEYRNSLERLVQVWVSEATGG